MIRTIIRCRKNTGHRITPRTHTFQFCSQILHSQVKKIFRQYGNPCVAKCRDKSLQAVHDHSVIQCFRPVKSHIPVSVIKKIFCRHLPAPVIINPNICNTPDGTVTVSKDQRDPVILLKFLNALIKHSNEYCPCYVP